jgi:hypothetical protein
MNVKILSWNIRGLNDRDKQLQVRSFIKHWGADVICRQETKIELVSKNFFVICGVFIMWIGCFWDQLVLLRVSC